MRSERRGMCCTDRSSSHRWRRDGNRAIIIIIRGTNVFIEVRSYILYLEYFQHELNVEHVAGVHGCCRSGSTHLLVMSFYLHGLNSIQCL